LALGRGRTPSVGIEALNLYALLRDAEAQSGVLGDAQDLAAFADSVSKGLSESLADKRRLHGRRTQNLFRAVVVSLDDIQMIKDEDVGTFYFDQAGPELKLPDFRVVRRDGEQLLVEVKNVGPTRVFRSRAGTPEPRVQRLRAAEVEAQRRYAKMTGARLVFAHYWAGINLWTVVDSHVPRRNGQNFELDIRTAMMANEFGMLGDCTVVTTATLVLSLFAGLDDSAADTGESVPVAIADFPFSYDGPIADFDLLDDVEEGYSFTIRKAEFSCDGKALTDLIEHKIAQYLFFFGSGEATTRARLDDDGRPVRIDVIWSSPAGGESPMVGSPLSSMYSARYIVATQQPDGTVTSLSHAPDPELARLIPRDYWDTKDRVLPLYLIHVRPNTESRGERR
jgi:hypothetical protein